MQEQSVSILQQPIIIALMTNLVLLCSSMMDGRLLQPSRPALSLDSIFVQRAFGSGGPDGHISVAYTEVID